MFCLSLPREMLIDGIDVTSARSNGQFGVFCKRRALVI